MLISALMKICLISRIRIICLDKKKSPVLSSSIPAENKFKKKRRLERPEHFAK